MISRQDLPEFIPVKTVVGDGYGQLKSSWICFSALTKSSILAALSLSLPNQATKWKSKWAAK